MLHDFSFLLEPPDFSVRGELTVEALTPLSMVTSMPGKYYRGQPEPSTPMLFGMLENILGWHFSANDRKSIIGGIKKRLGEPEQSGVGFISLLQYHVNVEMRIVPRLKSFDDLWSQHLHQNDIRHFNGARNYSWTIERKVNRFREEKGKKKGAGSAAGTRDNKMDQQFYDSIKDALPQYYVSPTPREYVIPAGPYKFILLTSRQLSNLFRQGADRPVAPAYLGSNDGWIEVTWEEL